MKKIKNKEETIMLLKVGMQFKHNKTEIYKIKKGNKGDNILLSPGALVTVHAIDTVCSTIVFRDINTKQYSQIPMEKVANNFDEVEDHVAS